MKYRCENVANVRMLDPFPSLQPLGVRTCCRCESLKDVFCLPVWNRPLLPYLKICVVQNKKEAVYYALGHNNEECVNSIWVCSDEKKRELNCKYDGANNKASW